MAYEKTIWKNREVERPRTYILQDNGDGTHTLVPAEGAIIEPGTPITAQVMQNIEDGIEALDNTLKSHLAETATDDVHGLRPVILWTGSVSAPGTVLNLSGNLEDFKRLVVGVSYGGNRYEVWELEALFLDLKSINLGDAGNSTRLTVYEARLRRISNTQLELEHNVEWVWTGNSGANATISANGSASVHYIYGYR